MKWYKESQVAISDGRMFHKGIVIGKKEDLYTFLWEKLDEIYIGEIHMFAKIYKAEHTASLGLLPGHVVFYKIDIIEIYLCSKVSMIG